MNHSRRGQGVGLRRWGSGGRRGAGAAGMGGGMSGAAVAAGEGPSKSVESLLRWDHQIEDMCLQVNRVVDAIQSKYPQYTL